MNRPHRYLIFALALVAQSTHGCGPDHERRMVFTAPREARVRAEAKPRLRAKPSIVKDVPAERPNPPSNGIDVPIIQPE